MYFGCRELYPCKKRDGVVLEPVRLPCLAPAGVSTFDSADGTPPPSHRHSLPYLFALLAWRSHNPSQ